jgi:uncharacterized membrane protein
VAWVATKTRIDSLRPIAGLLLGAFGYLLLPQILLLVQLAIASVLDIDVNLQNNVPIVNFPLFQLGIPAVFFLLAAYLFRMERDGKLVYALELAALALIAVMGHYVTAHLFHPGENVLAIQRTFLEHGIMTNVMFAFGLGCLVIARLYGRRAFGVVGVALAGVALFRTGYFGLLIKNPVWEHLEVAGVPLINALAVTFLLPIGWVWLTAREFIATGHERLVHMTKAVPMLTLALIFVWVNFEIRRLYQGSFLDGYTTSDAEFYTYSVVWLVFGLVLLFLGTLRGSQMMRYASLGLMLLTVTKVFLFDAGSLTGLLRVFSFLGLGLSLIGLSYFYGRFVFGGEAKAPDAPEGGTAPEGTPGGEPNPPSPEQGEEAPTPPLPSAAENDAPGDTASSDKSAPGNSTASDAPKSDPLPPPKDGG